MNFNKAINGEPETISEIDETTKLKIKTAFEQGDKKTLLELSNSNNISIAQYLSDYINVKSVEIGKILKTSDILEIFNNLKNMSNIDKYPKFKEEIEKITKILADYLNDLKSPSEPNNIEFDHLRDKSKRIAINEEYYELKLQQLFKNYSPENVETLKELSKMEDINFASAFINTFKQTFIDYINEKPNFNPSYIAILPECLLNIYKLDVIKYEPAIKDTIRIKDAIKQLVSDTSMSMNSRDIMPELLSIDNEIDQNAYAIASKIENAIRQNDAETFLELSKKNDIDVVTALSYLINHTWKLSGHISSEVQLEILKNLNNLPIIDNYPEKKQDVEHGINNIICGNYKDEIRFYISENDLENVTTYFNSMKSEMAKLNDEYVMMDYCDFLIDMYTSKMMKNNLDFKEEIKKTFEKFNKHSRLEKKFEYVLELELEEQKKNSSIDNITEAESTETIENKTSENAKSLDEEIVEKNNETIVENVTNLSETIKNVKLLMTRFIMENKDPEETEALKEEISKGVKECQNDPEAIDDIKGTLTTFIFFAGMPGLENKMSDLRKIIDNATSKDEIDI